VSKIGFGTVLVTGPTGGLGRSAIMAMAHRPEGERPDLLLVGRPGQALHDVGDEARAAGATVHQISCDLASLADVRVAGANVKDLLTSEAVHPLRGLVANAGLSVVDTRNASADGYELTFAVNYLAHAQLISGLLDSFTTPARIADPEGRSRRGEPDGGRVRRAGGRGGKRGGPAHSRVHVPPGHRSRAGFRTRGGAVD
jgi:NAD(P)-dependent dehydrogenase (short-subunit alcohol dehydrogenase family)